MARRRITPDTDQLSFDLDALSAYRGQDTAPSAIVQESSAPQDNSLRETADGLEEQSPPPEPELTGTQPTSQTVEVTGPGNTVDASEPVVMPPVIWRNAAAVAAHHATQTFTGPYPPGSASMMSRFADNLAAVKVLRTLTDQQRAATPDEQRVLASYTSWGGLGPIFNPASQTHAQRRGELLDALGDDATFKQLADSALDAYYTPTDVTETVWKVLETAGVGRTEAGTCHRILDAGCGSGRFFSPSTTCRTVGVDTDPIAAGIAQHLHPDATIINDSFAAIAERPGSFHAAVGNVPFGDVTVIDPDHNPDHHRIHDYFINKSLNLVAPGGYVAHITSVATADNRNPAARKAMTERADLVSALRLPSGTFSTTDTPTDLLVFRVRKPGQPKSELTEVFEASQPYEVEPGTTRHLNAVYAQQPQRVLGTMRIEGKGQFRRLVVDAVDNPLSQLDESLTRDVEVDRHRYGGFAPALEALPTGQPDEVALSGHIPLAGSLRYSGSTGSIDIQRYDHDTGWVSLTGQYLAQARRPEACLLIDLRNTAVDLREAYRADDTVRIAKLQADLSSQYEAYTSQYGPINRFTLHVVTPENQKLIDGLTAELFGDTKDDDLKAALKAAKTVEDLRRLYTDSSRDFEEFVDSVRDKLTKRTHDRPHLKAFSQDPEFATLLALEVFDEETQTATPAAVFTDNPATQARSIDHFDDIADAAAYVQAQYGQLDLSRVSHLMGTDIDTVTSELCARQLAFIDPRRPDELIARAHYLSGDVVTKLDDARRAAKNDPRLRTNIDALEHVQPTRIDTGVTVQPGVTWLPEQYYTDFIVEKFKLTETERRQVRLTVGDNGEWRVEGPKLRQDHSSNIDYGIVAKATYEGLHNFAATGEKAKFANQALACKHSRTTGLARTGFEIFEAAMNNKALALNYSTEYIHAKGLKAGAVYKEATAVANRQVQKLRTEFSEWILTDPQRRDKVLDLYNDRFNRWRAPVYDGSARHITGLGRQFSPYPYQLNAVERMVNEPSVLLNHTVGAGKTGSMVMGAMELKRLGLARQPWLVVPNHLVEQIAREASQWFPQARVLSGAEMSDKDDVAQFLAQSMTTDWDMVICPQSRFSKISVAPETRRAYIEGVISELSWALDNEQDRNSVAYRRTRDRLKRYETQLTQLTNATGKGGLGFEDLACDYLIVDEAHMFKNLARTSDNQDLNCRGSERASDMEVKIGIVRNKKAHQGLDPLSAPAVTFATGTPIANNVAELWVMTRYLRPDRLADMCASTINEFASQFVQNEQVTEVRPTGRGLKSVTRSTGYVNVGELANMMSSYSDVVTRADIPADLPTKQTGTTIAVTFSPEQEVVDFIRDLDARQSLLASNRWDGLARTINRVPEAIDNPLKMQSDGTSAALDPRLAGLEVDGPGSRISAVADTVHTVWQEHRTDVIPTADGTPSPKRGGLQVVFLDRGTPKANGGYSTYEALRQELASRGMDPTRIAFVHEWDDKRPELFRMCRDGDVDVLIGSTEKLGTGANIQTRLCALHHMDVPWRPADLEQREGRIIRQGNTYSSVGVYCYVAEGTLDGPRWQKVQMKATFIEQINQANATQRSVSNISESTAEIAAHHKALALGDPRYIEQVELGRAVEALQSEHNEWQARKASFAPAITAAQRDVDTAATNVEQMTAMARQRDEIMAHHGEGVTVTVGSVTYTGVMAEVQMIRGLMDKKLGPVTVNGVSLELKRDFINKQMMCRYAGTTVDPSPSIPLDELRAVQQACNDYVMSYHHDPNKSPVPNGMRRRILGRIERLDDAITREDAAHTRAVERLARIHDQSGISDQFDRIDELNDLKARYRQLSADLERHEETGPAKAAREAYNKRCAEKGREPGWSLRLNPTPALMEAENFTGSLDDYRAREREACAQRAADYQTQHKTVSQPTDHASLFDAVMEGRKLLENLHDYGVPAPLGGTRKNSTRTGSATKRGRDLSPAAQQLMQGRSLLEDPYDFGLPANQGYHGTGTHPHAGMETPPPLVIDEADDQLEQ